MRNSFLFILFSFFYCTAIAQIVQVQNVTVIDVNSGKAMPGYTVEINNGIISKVAPAKNVKAIEGSRVIDGTGKYLMPGMADAHIHFFQSGSLYTRPDGLDLRKIHPYESEITFAKNNATDYLERYLRLGITSVVDVGGPMANFNVRDSIAKTIVAPNVLVTGPLFSMVDRPQLGDDRPIIKITSKEAADSLMQQMLPSKPDFIKIWYIAGPTMPAEKNYDLVKYIAEQTHKNGLKLAVHATELHTAELAVDAGADILVHSVDDSLLPDAFIKKMLVRNVTLIPTLIVAGNYYKVFSGKLAHHPQDLAWANAFAYGSLTDPESMAAEKLPPVLKFLRSRGIPAEIASMDSIMALNLVKLVKAGVNIATGTDAGNIGTQHASSYLQEQEAMQAAGISVAEILKASTINVAKAFGKESVWGSIDKGKKADLLLLNSNPLQSLNNLNAIAMVIKDGKVLMPGELVQENAEAIVQRQLNAYNARDLDAFMNTYADEIKLYNFPNTLIAEGKEAMRKNYEGFFKNTTNLYCEIENRIVQGNTIIDKEKVRAGTATLRAVAVYEVSDGKIKKVTFIQ